jgi:hypothetical protein
MKQILYSINSELELYDVLKDLKKEKNKSKRLPIKKRNIS